MEEHESQEEGERGRCRDLHVASMRRRTPLHIRYRSYQ
jgi:hypothetical protein